MSTHQKVVRSTPLWRVLPCIDLAKQIEAAAVELDKADEAHRARITAINAAFDTKVNSLESNHSSKTSQALAQKTHVEQLVSQAYQAIGLDEHDIRHLPAPSRPADGGNAGYSPRLTPEALIEATKEASVAKTTASIQPGPIFGGIIVLVLIAMCQMFLAMGVAVIAVVYYAIVYSQWSSSRSSLIGLAGSMTLKAQEDFQKVKETSETALQSGIRGATAERDKSTAEEKKDYNTKRGRLMSQIESLLRSLNQKSAELALETDSADWSFDGWRNWQASTSFPQCLRIGTIMPEMPRFRAQCSHLRNPSFPALVSLEEASGIVIHSATAPTAAHQIAQTAILRLLATVPPAGVRFSFFDPVSLGGNVAGFIALEKYEPSLVGGKAWSDPRHIEQALLEVTDHMETVIQKYLRNEYDSISEYNAEARVKEPHRVVVVFDFPVNFSDTAAKRLVSIVRNGPRCGVIPIVLVDASKPMPHGFNLRDMEQFALVLEPSGK